MKLTILLAAIFSLTIFAQEDIEHILKVYPDWETNFEKHSVPYDELIGGGPPKDGIPAIVNPAFISFEKADEWLSPKEPVISVEINDEAKAYPLQILTWHEIVNAELAGVPIVVSFCPLCYSAIVYERTLDGNVTNFGVSGLLRNSDLVMYDQLTESLWQQFTGEAIVGDFTGTELKRVPSQIIAYKQFKDAYPKGKVLSRETGYDRNYGTNPYAGYDDVDDRLPPNSKVIAVKDEKNPKAYPYNITWKKKVINDEIGGKPVVVFHIPGAVSALDAKVIEESKETGSTGVYSRKVGDKVLSFKYEDEKIIDEQTGSNWRITGKAIDGELKGTELTKVSHGDYFAFAWFAFMPETEVYK